jgi:hypothetical protein
MPWLVRPLNTHTVRVEMDNEAVGFGRDIRPLFRDTDVDSMSGSFDLASYDDVRANADRILERLSDGSMPCDSPWPQERIELFRSWVSAGCPA